MAALVAAVAALTLLLSPGRLAMAADEAKPSAPGTQSAKADPWKPLRYFVGSWTGTAKGEPGNGVVKREYRFILGDRFLEAVNQSTYPPQDANPKGEVHEDRGMFSWDRARRRFVLRQFHVEGFVNEYVADSLGADAERIVFTTESIENIPAGFRGRETYRILGPDEFVERFEIAEPGKEFALYSETVLKRMK
ncbi:MAG TPA: hypothetical protein VFP58_08365 [Candidatus Eisenbacteria bacterium]|nr:hypothetical protein [Candidatus Eisenbacteria bacterium]